MSSPIHISICITLIFLLQFDTQEHKIYFNFIQLYRNCIRWDFCVFKTLDLNKLHVIIEFIDIISKDPTATLTVKCILAITAPLC